MVCASTRPVQHLPGQGCSHTVHSIDVQSGAWQPAFQQFCRLRLPALGPGLCQCGVRHHLFTAPARWGCSPPRLLQRHPAPEVRSTAVSRSCSSDPLHHKLVADYAMLGMGHPLSLDAGLLQ